MKNCDDSHICSIANSATTGHVHINLTETRLCNQFCRQKAVTITYSESVFVALGTHSECLFVVLGTYFESVFVALGTYSECSFRYIY